MFTFTDKLRDNLQAYIEKNFPYNPITTTLVSNILQYVAAQGLGYEETVDLLGNLLDGFGLMPDEIESCLTGEE